jgi:predicted amidohydrolase YtcJ
MERIISVAARKLVPMAARLRTLESLQQTSDSDKSAGSASDPVAKNVAVGFLDKVAKLPKKRTLGRSLGGRSLGLMVVAFAAVLFQDGAVYAKHADMILHGGRVFTSDTSALWAEAVAIRDGSIVATGSDQEVLTYAGKATHLVDLGGRLVVPGFNDAHVHTTPYGNLINAADFIPGGGPTVDEMLGYLAAAVQRYPQGTWLVGLMGETILNDSRMNRYLLDTVSPHHPVTLLAWWGHGAFINTAGMLTAGIPEEAPDPLGGWYERMPGTTVLNGSLHEYAGYRLSRQLADLTPTSDARAAMVSFAAAAPSLGITSVQDMSFYSSEKVQAILAGISLPVRLRNICFPFSPSDTCAPDRLNHPGAWTTWGGVKRILDGTEIEREAALFQPYNDLPTQLGFLNFSQDFLSSEMQQSLGPGKFYEQRISHAVGDRAVDALLGALAATAPAGRWQSRRPRLEHGDLITLAQTARLHAYGVVVVQNPSHVSWTSMLYTRLGPARAAQSHLSASLLHAGIPIAIGSDMSGQPFSPFVDLMLAVVHPTHPSEGLTLEEAVIAHTRGSAYAEFEEHRKGTLVPGMLADLVVLSQDIFSVPIEAVPATRSVLTMVGGNVVFSTGEIVVPSI